MPGIMHRIFALRVGAPGATAEQQRAAASLARAGDGVRRIRDVDCVVGLALLFLLLVFVFLFVVEREFPTQVQISRLDS